MGAVHNVDNRFNPDRILDYDFKLPGYGIPREEVLRLLNNPEVFSKARYEDKAIEGIRLLKEYGYNIKAYTLVPDNQEIYNIRREQISRLGLEGYIFKGDKAYIKNVWAIIDDSPHILNKYSSRTNRIIINQTYNKDYNKESIIRADNLLEAANILKSIEALELTDNI